jgi:hypothetical protein
MKKAFISPRPSSHSCVLFTFFSGQGIMLSVVPYLDSLTLVDHTVTMYICIHAWSVMNFCLNLVTNVLRNYRKLNIATPTGFLGPYRHPM